MTPQEDSPAAAWWQIRREDPDDERPFTDFGQFGYGQLDRRVFWQDIYWVDIAGTPHFLVDMSPGYRTNLIDFLQRGATGWWCDQIAYLAIEAACLILIDADEPTTRQALDQLEILIDIGAEEWMAASPLMRRLRALQSAKQADT